jgi:RNA polymerase sigma-70 factor (ECF subfamily)
MLVGCEPRSDRRWARQPGSVSHDALERGSCLRGFRRWRRNGAQALDQLCKTYWRPVFAFICRSGHPVPDAQDLTQDFFVTVLKGHLLQRADPDRGRFRSLLLKALKDFLANARIKHRALKRGGDAQFVSWDEWMAEVPSRLSISAKEAETWPAERIFDVRWAATAAEHALRQLGKNAKLAAGAACLMC